MRRAAAVLLLAVVGVVLVGLLLGPGPENAPRLADVPRSRERAKTQEPAEDLAGGMLNLEAPAEEVLPVPEGMMSGQAVAPSEGRVGRKAMPAAARAPAVPSGTFDDAVPDESIALTVPSVAGGVAGGAAPATDDREARAMGGTRYSGGGLRAVGNGLSGRGANAAQRRGYGAGAGSGEGRHPDAPPEAKPQVTTWKRSQLTPNTSRLMVGDTEELPLRGLQVDARIDGFRARVVLDCFYYNDQRRRLEGSFQLRLPNGASPYYFALAGAAQSNPNAGNPNAANANAGNLIAPQVQTYFLTTAALHRAGTSPQQLWALRTSSDWQQAREARVVPKEKAAYAYTETVRQKIDPALVEWAGAGIFQSRVFPLEPGKLHRIVVGYDVDLLPVGDDLEFRLELPELKVPCVADVNVASPSGTAIKIDTAAAFHRSDDGRANFRFDNWNGREIVLRTTPPGPVLLTGSDPQTGPYFATRVRPTLPPATSAAGSSRGVFLLDTSLSASPEQFTVWLKLLKAVLQRNRDSLREFAVLLFNVEAHWWQEKFVANTPENVEELIDYAHTLSLEGATDLGQALADAVAPAWLKDTGERHDVFLLSDAAATWGESDPTALARTLKSGSAGPLFAYSIGMAGADPQMMATLTRESGGAVFSVVGDAEVAAAAVAHRTRPWHLVDAAVDGGSDVLIAGRPRTIFPDQNLLVVGRGKPSAAGATVALTLRQGDEQQVIKTRLAAEIESELAPRAYGQVAVDQLEELPEVTAEGSTTAATSSGRAAGDLTAKDLGQITTAFARHFWVTGRTCSLVMLESEEDYRRFGIKPELDQFVVQSHRVETLIGRSEAQQAKAAANAKAVFLAWLEKLEKTPGAKFEVPLALRLALEQMPPEAFEVRAPRLVCKGRTHAGQSIELQEQLGSRQADYDLIAAEAERRLKELGPHDALRVLSSLIEQSPGDVVLSRDVAFSAMEWQLAGHAYFLLRRVAVSRPFEPQAYHALARCLEELGNADLALAYYEVCLAGQWDERYRDFTHIVTFDYLRLLRAIAQGKHKTAAADYAAAQLFSLARQQAQPSYGLVVIVGWNTDRTDVDLHVTEPSGEICSYTNTRTAQGGSITRDVTQGYGPEMYVLPRATAGDYRVRVRYFASDANRASARTKVYATVYQDWGTPREKVLRKAVILERGQTEHQVGEVKVE
jgi:hypothetical protein